MPTLAATGAELAHDVRAGRRWSARQRFKNALIRAVILGTLAVVDRLPGRMLLALGRALGAAAHRMDATGRGRARETIARACPELDATRLARESYVTAGESLAVCLLLRRTRTRALDLVEVGAEARSLLEGGSVVVSAHLGPFELIAAAAAELGFRPAVLVRESYDPRLDRVVDAHRLARGVSVIHRGSAGAGFGLLRALRAGRPVGVLPDLGGRVPSIPVRFLGALRSFPEGPARLVAASRARLVCMTLASKQTGSTRYSLVARELDPNGSVAELSQRIAAAIEHAILSEPRSWLWMGAPRSWAEIEPPAPQEARRRADTSRKRQRD